MRRKRKQHQNPSADTPTEPIWVSRKARRTYELAQATTMLTNAKQHAARVDAELGATPAREEPSDDTSEGLPLSTRLLIAFTAVVVLGIALVIAVVVIGTQIGFYRSEMKVQLVDLSKIGIDTPLDLPTFTPIATEGVAWACTLMAVVLVMLNRPSGIWTKSMWFFSGINAAVNAWHALDTDRDLLGAVVKGGLSIAGPFIVHLFILWVRHVRTGKTLEEARHDLVIRWQSLGRLLLGVLGVLADHVTHPLIARRAFSLWRLYRGAAYSAAWRAAVAEKLDRDRRRREHRSRRSSFMPRERSRGSGANDEANGERLNVQPTPANGEAVNGGTTVNGEREFVHEAPVNGERESVRDTEVNGSEVNADEVNEATVNDGEEMAAFTEGLFTSSPLSMNENELNDAFTDLIRQMNDGESVFTWTRSPVSTCNERVNGSGSLSEEEAFTADVNATDEHSEVNVQDAVNAAERGEVNAPSDVNGPEVNAADPDEQSAVNAGERDGVNAEVNVSIGRGGVNAPDDVNSERGERSPTGKVNVFRATGERKGTNASLVIAHYWKLVDGNEQAVDESERLDLEKVKRKSIAEELDLPEGTVRRVWAQCLKGKHRRP